MRLGVARALVNGAMVPGDVVVEEERIIEIGRLPAGRGTAAPGLVDLQVNGFDGVPLEGARPDDVARIGQRLLRTGTTAYLPTLISAPPDRMRADVRAIAAAAADPPPRTAEILGIHLEGPFLSPRRPGAHPPEHLRAPDLVEARALVDAGPVTLVTLAPELEGAGDLIALLRARGVTVSCGHTDATAAQAHAAFNAGARTVTHLFNAMRPLRSRDPGVIGAALTRGDVVLQVIADGVHLAPETLRLIWGGAAGRCALVSDMMCGAGRGDGRWPVGDQVVTVSGPVARRDDGTLAGSVTALDGAVRHLVGLGLDAGVVLDAATRVPAQLMRRPDLGVLAPGHLATVTVFDDDLRLKNVLLRGEEVL